MAVMTVNLHREAAHQMPAPLTAHPLDGLFAPKTVAVIGATDKPGSVGRTLMQNLLGNVFGGTVYPVNPQRSSVLGVKAYPAIGALPENIDLAVIATPAPTVPGIIGECVQAGVRGAIIISAGFKECGPAGAELERQILEAAPRDKLRIIGPNCLGVMLPHLGLNATFAKAMAHPGSVGFISQSGALCAAVLDWSLRESVGFSAFISIGSMLDVGWGDLIYYLGDDPRTKSILIYMESIGDARSFLSAAREVALTKPIIVTKVGRTRQAARAAASHTGALTGSDKVLGAAFRRVGVLRVNTIEELFDMAEVLAKQPCPKGPKLLIVTNAGGPGILAADRLVFSGGELAQLSPDTLAALDQLLPPQWNHDNPIDILDDAGPERYARAVEIAARDPNNDGLLVILTPQEATEPTATAERLKPFAELEGKPILASWMGGAKVESGAGILNKANIPTFDYPDAAARAFYYMWRYNYNLRALYETPSAAGEWPNGDINQSKVAGIIQAARQASRTLLSQAECYQILEAYGIATVEIGIASSEAQALELARKMGFPVVLKLHSQTISHKTEVGGVELNLRGAAAVRRAYRAIKAAVARKCGPEHFLGVIVEPMIALEKGYELILGSSIDPQFGPVLLFGAGGQLVEVFEDFALGLPPLNATLARRLMEQTCIYSALQNLRAQRPVDLAALERLLVRFSHLVVEQPWIKEIDINPLLVSAQRPIVLDARMVLHGAEVVEAQLPKPAIRPYPSEYVTQWKAKDGSPLVIRPIRPEDEPLMVKFHQNLSESSLQYRYFTPLKANGRITHERLARVCFNDYDREIALVGERKAPGTGEAEIIGLGRLGKVHGRDEAECAIVISDAWQRRGLGTQLLKMLVQIGRIEKLARITARIRPENQPMQEVCRKAGFTLRHENGEPEWEAEIRL
jgi:acetyltransferase